MYSVMTQRRYFMYIYCINNLQQEIRQLTIYNNKSYQLSSFSISTIKTAFYKLTVAATWHAFPSGAHGVIFLKVLYVFLHNVSWFLRIWSCLCCWSCCIAIVLSFWCFYFNRKIFDMFRYVTLIYTEIRLTSQDNIKVSFYETEAMETSVLPLLFRYGKILTRQNCDFLTWCAVVNFRIITVSKL